MRCAHADSVAKANWPWDYCGGCRFGPSLGRGRAFTPYFAPGIRERGEWDCADFKKGDRKS